MSEGSQVGFHCCLLFPLNVRTLNPATAPGTPPWKWANKSFSLLSHLSDLIFDSCLGLLEGHTCFQWKDPLVFSPCSSRQQRRALPAVTVPRPVLRSGQPELFFALRPCKCGTWTVLPANRGACGPDTACSCVCFGLLPALKKQES